MEKEAPTGRAELVEHASFLAAVTAEADAVRGSEDFPAADIATIERAVRLRGSAPTPGPLADDVAAVAAAAAIHLDVPTASRIPLARGVKVGVKRLVGWYVADLARQVTALGGAVVRLGQSTSSRLEQLGDEVHETEHSIAQLAQENERLVAELDARVGRLERGTSSP